jgi:hypothetical protein
MPRMNGYEFVKEAKDIDRQVKTILMSAFEVNDDEELHNILTDIKIDGFLHYYYYYQLAYSNEITKNYVLIVILEQITLLSIF